MKILLISDNPEHANTQDILHEDLIKKLKEKYTDFKILFATENDLKPCIGCFKCWLKTPGICIMKNSSQNISKDIIESDLLIFVTEIKYGSYSTAIKRVWDKQLPLLLPFFTIINNEMHHSARYKKYPNIMVVGYGENITVEEEKTLSSLVTANAVNFHSKEAKTYICHDESEVGTILNNMFMYISNMGGEK